MNWLTLPIIKKQLRLEPDFTDEDDLLQLYGDSAEEMILNTTRRTVDELKAMNAADTTKVPQNLVHASLMLVEASYSNRSVVSMQNMYAVPYGYDMLVKPYVRLSSREEEAL